MIGTGRAERQMVEQNRLYGEHFMLKQEQYQLQEEQNSLQYGQAMLLSSEGELCIQRFDIHWSENILTSYKFTQI